MNIDFTNANIKSNFSINFEKVALETAFSLASDGMNKGAIKQWADVMAKAATKTLEEVIKAEEAKKNA